MWLTKKLLQTMEVFFMDKKFFTLLAVFIVAISVASVCAVETTNHDFNGLFKMDVPSAENFINSTESGLYAPELSAALYEFGDEAVLKDGADLKDNITVYYYDESTISGEYKAGNTTDFVTSMLKSNSVYMDEPTQEDSIFIWNDTVSQSDAKYLVGVSSDDDTKMVCIEGFNLDDLKTYANSVEF